MTKTKWRIYTEYVHTRHIAEIVSKYFADYSMFSGIGHDDGDRYRCLVIEIINHAERSDDIISICQEINSDNHQKFCTITAEQVDITYGIDKLPVM